MPMPQENVAIVGNAPNAPIQAYVAVVDASGNVISGSYGPPGGRLTLTTLTPVLTATVSAAATVLYTPYQSDIVPIYNGTSWLMTQFTELTNTLANSSVGSAGPAAAVASTNYDLFVWNNAGVMTLTRGPAWTSATARAAGGALALVNGINLNAVAITNGPAIQRGTWVGTIFTDAGGATVSMSFGSSAAAGGAALLDVWNAYNRRLAAATVIDSTFGYNYTAAAARAADASNTNRITLVRGADEDTVAATYSQKIQLAAAANAFAQLFVGLDSITAASGQANGGYFLNEAAAAIAGTVKANYTGLPGLGNHFLQALEASDGTNANVFNQVGGFGSLQASVWC